MAVDGTITDEYIAEPAIQGNDVILTIDASLQAATENALKNNIENIRNGKFKTAYEATGGAMVVMNVKTGEILALASNPDYDPSKFTFGIDPETWEIYKTSNMKNRAISEIYPPGSTYKMITAVAGLETGAIDKHTKINDTYRYTYYKGYQPHCWKPGRTWLVKCNFCYRKIVQLLLLWNRKKSWYRQPSKIHKTLWAR